MTIKEHHHHHRHNQHHQLTTRTMTIMMATDDGDDDHLPSFWSSVDDTTTTTMTKISDYPRRKKRKTKRKSPTSFNIISNNKTTSFNDYSLNVDPHHDHHERSHVSSLYHHECPATMDDSLRPHCCSRNNDDNNKKITYLRTNNNNNNNNNNNDTSQLINDTNSYNNNHGIMSTLFWSQLINDGRQLSCSDYFNSHPLHNNLQKQPNKSVRTFSTSSSLSTSYSIHKHLLTSIIFLTISLFLNNFQSKLLLLSSSTSNFVLCLHWQENIEPKTRIHHLKEYDLFVGNDTSKDYFKYLDRDGEYLLIGARNFVYNISLPTLKENRKLEWSSSEEDIRMCKYKGKSEEACQNYIKVLAKLSDDRILVCGTNAFKPKCRSYQYGPMHNFLKLSEKSGEAICPYDPSYSSTYTFYGSFRERTEKNLYVATVAGFTGADPLIYREPLRTEQFNPKHLNAPNFVSSFPHNGHVYFLFRETAVEYINCGKAIFSRVARVCSKDNGGPHKFRARWTTFLKARLNCSIPGDFPFYFNEIQASSEIVKGLYGGRNEQLIYGVFNTPVNSIGGSAICAFRMEDIEGVFRGPFKGQKDIDSNWLPVPPLRVPAPRPGECSNDSQSLPEMTLNFIKEHPLMDHVVPSFWNAPILVRTSFHSRFTSIAVHPQIETASGMTYDVLFIGTNNGTVIKAINAASPLAGHANHNSVVPVVIEEITVFPSRTPVTQLLVHPSHYNAKLVVISPGEIKTIRLYRCQAKTCGECVRLQDPYCSFDLQLQKCTSSRSRYWNRENFVQNIELGWDPRCPDGRPGMVPNEENNSDNSINVDDSESDLQTGPSAVPIYSSETFALAVVTSVVTSLVFGFIIGYIFSRRCRKDDPGICSPYDDPHSYLDPHNFAGTLTSGHGAAGLTRLAAHGQPGMGPLYGTHGTLGHYSSAHGPVAHGDMGTLVNSKPINLVLNVTKGGSKNANSSADNKPMMPKVKKIYL